MRFLEHFIRHGSFQQEYYVMFFESQVESSTHLAEENIVRSKKQCRKENLYTGDFWTFLGEIQADIQKIFQLPRRRYQRSESSLSLTEKTCIQEKWNFIFTFYYTLIQKSIFSSSKNPNYLFSNFFDLSFQMIEKIECLFHPLFYHYGEETHPMIANLLSQVIMFTF